MADSIAFQNLIYLISLLGCESVLLGIPVDNDKQGAERDIGFVSYISDDLFLHRGQAFLLESQTFFVFFELDDLFTAAALGLDICQLLFRVKHLPRSDKGSFGF